MREQPVYEQYSDDKSYKLEIHQRADGWYEVRARRKITDEYMETTGSSIPICMI